MKKYEVRTKLQHVTDGPEHAITGVLGPFKTYEAAERAVVGLCQSGKITTAQIVEIDDTHEA